MTPDQFLDHFKNVWPHLCDAFEDRARSTGHDLGGAGAVAVIQAWEEIRNAVMVRALKQVEFK